LVIPAELRKELGLKPGVRVSFRKRGKGLLIEHDAYAAVLALRGKYQGLPLEADLAESRRLDEERAEEKLEGLYESMRS
jgi:bifunctional DNA-binding transcriptional regulator/antitoxin component of YhaV-PrlF toxin-antitoxin module